MNASVVAVIRRGQRVSGKMGDVVLEGGDVLLLDAADNFDMYGYVVKVRSLLMGNGHGIFLTLYVSYGYC